MGGILPAWLPATVASLLCCLQLFVLQCHIIAPFFAQDTDDMWYINSRFFGLNHFFTSFISSKFKLGNYPSYQPLSRWRYAWADEIIVACLSLSSCFITSPRFLFLSKLGLWIPINFLQIQILLLLKNADPDQALIFFFKPYVKFYLAE